MFWLTACPARRLQRIMLIWIFRGNMMRSLMVVLFVWLSVAPANAQDEMSEVRTFIDWSSRISSFNQEIVGLMSAAYEADNITAAYEQGQIDAAAASGYLIEWRSQVDAELLRLGSVRDELAAGPAQYPETYTESVAGMIANVSSTLVSIVDFFSMTEAATQRAISGDPVDVNLLTASRFGVLQQYYVSLIRTNEIAIATGDESHPQTFLLAAMNENMASTIMVFEIARQALGAEQSEHHVRNTTRFFRARQRALEEALEQSRLRYRATRAQIAAQPIATEEDQRILGVVLQLVDSYPLSIEIELRGSAIQTTAAERLEGADTEAIGLFLNEIGVYESEREAMQIARTGLAGQL
jgi:hypothetical protein